MGYIREVQIDAPLQKVWQAWSSRLETERWLAPRANIEFVAGGAYEFFWSADPSYDSTVGCRVLEIEGQQRLLFEWQGNHEFIDLFLPPNERTFVEARFAAEGDAATRLVIEQRETRSIPGWAAYDEWMADAWEEALLGLKRYCEGEDSPPYWQR